MRNRISILELMPKRRLMPFEQRLMPLENHSQLKGMKVNAFSEDFA